MDLNVYIELIAEALESMADNEENEPTDPIRIPSIPAIAALVTVTTWTHAFLSKIPRIELNLTASLVMGERTVEIPGLYTLLETPSRP